MDWTESPHVAMFFALEEERDEGKCSAVWAVNLDWLETTRRRLLKAGEDILALDSGMRADRVNGLLARTVLGPEKEAGSPKK
jgi:hypothetical protein